LFPLRDVNPTRVTPVVTLALIGVNLIVFFLIQGRGTSDEQQALVYERAAISCEVTTGFPLGADEIVSNVCLDGAQDPIFPEKNVFLALLTSMFLHGSVGHVLFNMWFLWIFGNNVEEAFGHIGFLLMYVIGGLAATAAYVGLNPDATIPLVGASGDRSHDGRIRRPFPRAPDSLPCRLVPAPGPGRRVSDLLVCRPVWVGRHQHGMGGACRRIRVRGRDNALSPLLADAPRGGPGVID
jgi:hypothetical protein